MGVRANSNEPTYLCLLTMKVLATDNIDAEARLRGWIAPWWLNRPVGFNAGWLKDERVPYVVERLNRIGTVNEVQFHGGSLDGLRLFYIGRFPDGRAWTWSRDLHVQGLSILRSVNCIVRRFGSNRPLASERFPEPCVLVAIAQDVVESSLDLRPLFRT